MQDAAFSVDSKEDLVYLFGGAVVVLAAAAFTPVDAHARLAAVETATYFQAAPEDADLAFTEEQATFLNEVSGRSLGLGIADERLFCFMVGNGHVQHLRLADDITVSETDRVGGRCASPSGSTLHTHPDGMREPSDEDAEAAQRLNYMCIQYDEVVVGPRGGLAGVDCYRGVDGDVERVEVRIGG